MKEMDHQDMCISSLEHKILNDNKKLLESRHKVKILMPELQKYDCPTGEVIVVEIEGESQNIGFVQRFLQERLKLAKSEKEDNDESIIILNSDSEDDIGNESILSENNTYKPKHKKRRLETNEVDLVSLDVIPCAYNSENCAPICDVTSTTDADESVIIIDPLPVEEFIPICANKQSKESFSTKVPVQVNEVVELSSDEEDAVQEDSQLQTIPIPPTINVRKLRPVVIDGSNVARAHGKPSNTFSCKGIKICVEYFLKRGHPQVTAFVPLYRRHCKRSFVPTTDQDILNELEKTQHVVFTPSRRIDGKGYSCYDDRFIVELAAANGGVILSNDNYNDLLDESPSFSETIKNRLLMYCFVGDMLMIPADPLGSKGPKLDEYLSFPSSANDSNL